MAIMTCETARQEMLIGDLDELRRDADSALATHLKTCAQCRSRAEAILDGYNNLNIALSEWPVPVPKARELARARHRTPYLWLPLPLAAAAALALLLIRNQKTELPDVDAIARLILPEAPIVAPATGQQAVVMEEDGFTIVWLYDQEKL